MTRDQGQYFDEVVSGPTISCPVSSVMEEVVQRRVRRPPVVGKKRTWMVDGAGKRDDVGSGREMAVVSSLRLSGERGWM